MGRNFYSWRDDDQPITRTPDEARQGVTGHKVRRVLGWGLTGALVAMAALLSFA